MHRRTSLVETSEVEVALVLVDEVDQKVVVYSVNEVATMVVVVAVDSRSGVEVAGVTGVVEAEEVRNNRNMTSSLTE